MNSTIELQKLEDQFNGKVDELSKVLERLQTARLLPDSENRTLQIRKAIDDQINILESSAQLARQISLYYK